MEGSAGRAGDWGTPLHQRMAESPGVRWEGYGLGTLDDRPPHPESTFPVIEPG